ncbi:MAG: carbon-nitrogen hydrolase family protein [Anaerolineales bacterium]
MRIAVVQMEPVWKDEQANWEQIDRRLDQLAGQGVQLAVFPECSLSGYDLSPTELPRFASPIPGPQSEKLVQLAQKHGLLFQVGVLEKGGGDTYFNSCLLASPQGLIGSYRKTHLPHLGVDRYLEPGDRLGPVYESRIGSLICYDLRLPEPARVLSLLGAQILLISTAWPESATLYPDFVARTRAAENGVFLAAANRIGREGSTTYLGRSLVVDPSGSILSEASGAQSETLICDLDLRASDEKRRIFVPGEYELDLVADRRPDLYHVLTKTDPD